MTLKLVTPPTKIGQTDTKGDISGLGRHWQDISCEAAEDWLAETCWEEEDGVKTLHPEIDEHCRGNSTIRSFNYYLNPHAEHIRRCPSLEHRK